MARKKDQAPPFEIMGKAPPRRPAPGPAPPRRSPVEPGPAMTHAAPEAGEGLSIREWKRWLAHSGPPLLLRVPRGVAIAVVVGVLGLIVLAYWVGSERGASAVRTAHEAEAAAGNGFGRAPVIRGGLGPRPIEAAPGGDASSLFVEDPPGDPRQAGLNYLVLATWNDADARRLADFLAGQGVATLLEPWNNTRLRVVAVERGFAAGEGDAMRDYRNRLLDVGRAWKRHNHGRGTALEDMHYDKFEG